MTGRQTHIALLADCERGLGRPERAVDMWRRTEQRSVGAGEWVELLIVAAGARRDLGQTAAAVTMLQIPPLEVNGTEPWRARLRYAYADSLAAAGRTEEAYRWFARTIELDPQAETDAVDRLLELEGVVIEGDDHDDDATDAADESPAGEVPASAERQGETGHASPSQDTASGGVQEGRDRSE